jgi:midasin (ATPase involved in ribosome maturation)
MVRLIESTLIQSVSKKTLEKPPVCPGDSFVQFEQFWLPMGPEPIQQDATYILTDSIRAQLRNLARIVLSGKYPVLLQGPTSAGKTSMVAHLAKATGHRFVRINNHEHTDIQEYLGQYVADETGRLAFHEGILAEAVRKGYWVVLDELNLAPSEVSCIVFLILNLYFICVTFDILLLTILF